MNKILLATTALFVVGGISAASADITITGGAEFKYKTFSGVSGATFGSTTSFKLSADRELDNGLMLNGYTGQDGTTGAFNDHGFSLTGDFGTVGFAGLESGDAFATGTADTPDEGHHSSFAPKAGNPASDYVDGADVSWLSPSVNGLQFSYGVKDGGEGMSNSNMVGAKYSTTSMMDTTVTVQYAKQSGGTKDADSLGFKLAYGDLSASIARNTATTSDHDVQSNSFGVTYAISDMMTVSAYSGKSTDGLDPTYEASDKGYGASYTVTPGLVLHLTHNQYATKGSGATEGDQTAFAINVNF